MIVISSNQGGRTQSSATRAKRSFFACGRRCTCSQLVVPRSLNHSIFFFQVMACTVPTHGWTDNFKRIFTRRSRSVSGFPTASNFPLTSNPAGILWRSVLAQSIFSDLSLKLASGRRFLPLHHLGLCGVILYELPGQAQNGEFTISSVFGDSSDPGMDTEELLDGVRAKLVYAPAYACTSFVVSIPSCSEIHLIVTISVPFFPINSNRPTRRVK